MCNLQCGEFINIPGMTKLVQLEPNASIGVWAIDLSSIDIQAYLPNLSPAELERASRFVCTQDQTNYLAAHTALRHLLAHATGIAAETLSFTHGPAGKPFLANAAACHFNLSHSGHWALVGISHGSEIGVDIEVLRPLEDMPALATQVLSLAEQAELLSLSDVVQRTAFLRYWTRKEACLKAWGCGLQIEPHEVHVGVGNPTQSAVVVHHLQANPLLVQTHLQHVQFVASVAVTT
jgi:4'-phosphopantetheinyl transferase